MKKFFEVVKYYTLERPILYITYIIIGFFIFGYLLCSSYIPVYHTCMGNLQLEDNKYVVTLHDKMDDIQGKIYIYMQDLSKRMVVEDYVINDENQIEFNGVEEEFDEVDVIKCRVETSQEKLIKKIIVNGGK